MRLRTSILTNNECYTKGRTMTPKGILVHSTGCNNNKIGRYVGPDDGVIGAVNSANWNQPRPDGRQVCVHAFIGKVGDGSIATYQTLPWNYRGWHSGQGSKGSCNDMGYIGFEICEDDTTDPNYFNQVYWEAANFCAFLCCKFKIPTTSPSLICHSEANKLGIGSNHSDVMHWFPKHGKSMDTFRADVERRVKMEGTERLFLTVNDQIISVTTNPIITESGDVTNFVGLREVAEALGAKVGYVGSDFPQVSLKI